MGITDTGRWGLPEDIIYGEGTIGLTGAGSAGAHSDMYLLYASHIALVDGCIDTYEGWHKYGDSRVPAGGDSHTPFSSIRIEETYNNINLLKEMSYGATSVETFSEDLAAGSLSPASMDAGDQEAFGEAGMSIIAEYSLGLGTIEFMTTYDDSDTGSSWDYRSYAYFTYGGPGVTDPGFFDDLIMSTFDHVVSDSGQKQSQEWQAAAWNLSTDEKVGLQSKFGHLEVGGEEAYDPADPTTNPLYYHLSSSMVAIVESLVTTFPENVLTFARTRPLKLKHKDIYSIETDEELESIEPTTTPTMTEY